jgi:hypothetical protein
MSPARATAPACLADPRRLWTGLHHGHRLLGGIGRGLRDGPREIAVAATIVARSRRVRSSSLKSALMVTEGVWAGGPPARPFRQRYRLRGRTDCIASGADAACDCALGTRSPTARLLARLALCLCAWSGCRWPWSSSRPTNPSVRCASGALCSALPWSAAAKVRVRAGSLAPPFPRLGCTLGDVALGTPSPCLTSR